MFPRYPFQVLQDDTIKQSHQSIRCSSDNNNTDPKPGESKSRSTSGRRALCDVTTNVNNDVRLKTFQNRFENVNAKKQIQTQYHRQSVEDTVPDMITFRKHQSSSSRMSDATSSCSSVSSFNDENAPPPGYVKRQLAVISNTNSSTSNNGGPLLKQMLSAMKRQHNKNVTVLSNNKDSFRFNKQVITSVNDASEGDNDKPSNINLTLRSDGLSSFSSSSSSSCSLIQNCTGNQQSFLRGLPLGSCFDELPSSHNNTQINNSSRYINLTAKNNENAQSQDASLPFQVYRDRISETDRLSSPLQCYTSTTSFSTTSSTAVPSHIVTSNVAAPSFSPTISRPKHSQQRLSVGAPARLSVSSSSRNHPYAPTSSQVQRTFPTAIGQSKPFDGTDDVEYHADDEETLISNDESFHHRKALLEEAEKLSEACSRTSLEESRSSESSSSISSLPTDGVKVSNEHKHHVDMDLVPDFRAEELTSPPTPKFIKIARREKQVMVPSTQAIKDIFECSEYKMHILHSLRVNERKYVCKPTYMSKQPDITHGMRSILVDWLVGVGEEYKLGEETIHLSINYLDRFLSVMSVQRAKLQLVGTACIFVASKYEEIYPPDVGEFAYITDNTYTKKQVLRMEHLILKVLNFDLKVSTAFVFVEAFAMMGECDQTTTFLAQYLCELTLLDGDVYLSRMTSHIAAACLTIARFNTSQSFDVMECGTSSSMLRSHWPESKISPYFPSLHSTFIESEEFDTCLQEVQAMFVKVPHMVQQAIPDKYKADKYHRVAMINPRMPIV